MQPQVRANVIIDLLAHAYVVVYTGLISHTIRCFTRSGFLKTTLDTPYTSLAMLDLSELTYKGFPICSKVSPLAGAVLQFTLSKHFR
jgi:hypothetical protein